MDRTCFVFGLLRLLSGMALMFHAADSVEGHGGIKTEFCPDVAGICPGVSGILSHSDRGLSASALPWGRLFRRGAQCSGEKQVKSEGSGGADVTVVREMQCSEDAPRARARWEPGYDLEGVDQGQSVQAVVEDFQWGRMLDGRWSFFLPRTSRKARKVLRKGDPLYSVILPTAGVLSLRTGNLFNNSTFSLSVSCSLRSARIAFGPTPSLFIFVKRVGGLVLVWGVVLRPPVACGKPGLHPGPPRVRNTEVDQRVSGRNCFCQVLGLTLMSVLSL